MTVSPYHPHGMPTPPGPRSTIPFRYLRTLQRDPIPFFAWMEAVLIVATIAQRWKLELVSRDVTPQASITLRPKGGIRMRVRRS